MARCPSNFGLLSTSTGTGDQVRLESARSIKNLVIGRKNWLFSTSVDGAYATAVLTTMVRSALVNKLDPYQYLIQVLNKLPYVESDENFEEMMPWNVKARLGLADSQERVAA